MRLLVTPSNMVVIERIPFRIGSQQPRVGEVGLYRLRKYIKETKQFIHYPSSHPSAWLEQALIERQSFPPMYSSESHSKYQKR